MKPPASLPFATSDHYDRAAHTYGKSYPELARGIARDYANAPDVVAYPRNEAEVAAVLDWAGGADATVTPFGGGSSVCGGVEPLRDDHKGAVTLDLREMGKVIEVDKTSRAALIEGGTYGPVARSAAQAARPHAAPFPAELRIFDARRLDRDARRRPLRDALHAHRRFR